MAQLLDFRNIPRTMQASDTTNLDAYRANITKNVCDSVILHYRLRLTAINQLNLCETRTYQVHLLCLWLKITAAPPHPHSVMNAQLLWFFFCEDCVRSAQRLRRRIVDCAADCADGFAGANVRIRTQRMKSTHCA